jgi:glutamate carboxypeptidase
VRRTRCAPEARPRRERAFPAEGAQAGAPGHATACRTVRPVSTASPWIAEAAEEIAVRAERELDALVGVSSPSGDVASLEEAAAIVTALLPPEAAVERPDCSSPGHAPDLLVRLQGAGDKRLLLLGHLDTVVPHADHRPLERRGERLVGSGAVDMKGGLVLALGVLRALAATRDAFAEAALLTVADEEWRTHDFVHGERFAGFDACLCFEAGERGPGGEEGVVVRRKAAATLLVRATGASAHSGTAPDRGRNALLAVAAAAERVATAHDPDGAHRLTAVPTVLRSGDAFNVVPSAGELWCDLRADSVVAFQPVLEALPDRPYGASLDAEFIRYWPGMDTREASAPLIEVAGRLLGRPVVGVERGGASDASHMAAHVPVTVDGLGPRGGGAHTPDEFVDRDSLRQRAEVALAVTAAVLGLDATLENAAQ